MLGFQIYPHNCTCMTCLCYPFTMTKLVMLFMCISVVRPKSCKSPDSHCCPYLYKNKARWAQHDQMFSDGCNTCTCLGGARRFCTLSSCGDMCSYQNWDGVFGHVMPGRRRLKVLDESDGCRRNCKCSSKNDEPSLVCSKKCLKKKGAD